MNFPSAPFISLFKLLLKNFSTLFSFHRHYRDGRPFRKFLNACHKVRNNASKVEFNYLGKSVKDR